MHKRVKIRKVVGCGGRRASRTEGESVDETVIITPGGRIGVKTPLKELDLELSLNPEVEKVDLVKEIFVEMLGQQEQEVTVMKCGDLVRNAGGDSRIVNQTVTAQPEALRVEPEPGGDAGWTMPNVEFHRTNFQELQAEMEQVTSPADPEQEPDYAWYCCVLWDPKVCQKLEDHRSKWGSGRYSTMSIAKKLSKGVVEANRGMDWEKPFKLLELIGHGFSKDGDQLKIRVGEMTTANNCHVPEASRPRYNLVLRDSYDQLCLAQEVTRIPNVLTVIMLWNYEVDLFESPILEDPGSEERIAGCIYLKEPKVDCVPSILIFHGDWLTPSRIHKIQGMFYVSELRNFDKPGIQRLTQWTVLSKEENQFAAHLSRPYRIDQGPCSESPVLYIEDVTESEEEEDEDDWDLPIDNPMPPPPPQPPQITRNRVDASLQTILEESQMNGSGILDSDSDSDTELGLLFTNQREVDLASTTPGAPSRGEPELSLENPEEDEEKLERGSNFSQCIDQLSQDIVTLM